LPWKSFQNIEISMDEIDSIFTKRKGQPEFKQPLPKKKANKVKKKVKAPETTGKVADKAETQNVPVVETIVFGEKNIEKQALPEDDFFQNSRGTRSIVTTDIERTEDGLPIYLDEELKIGLGKDTPDCPFDCSCCF
jgi:hypothetical protein